MRRASLPFPAASAQQRRVLNIMKLYARNEGEFPSIRFVARKMGIRPQTVQEYIQALYAKGLLASPSPSGVRCLHLDRRRH